MKLALYNKSTLIVNILKSLRKYLHRWKIWVHAGLPLQVHSFDNVIQSVADKVTSLEENGNSQRSLYKPKFSVFYWHSNFKKGK